MVDLPSADIAAMTSRQPQDRLRSGASGEVYRAALHQDPVIVKFFTQGDAAAQLHELRWVLLVVGGSGVELSGVVGG